MEIKQYANTLIVDIHTMTCSDAKKELERLLSRADKCITEITVIHGYHDGTVLLNMVRKSLKHRRIARKILSINNGQTTLILKKQ